MPKLFGEKFATRRAANADALKAFELTTAETSTDSFHQVIHEGSGPTVMTIGYEKRNGDELASELIAAGVDVLVDVRERPFSRKPDFREKKLREICQAYGLTYRVMKGLGSTANQRDFLKETGDLPEFMRQYKSYLRRWLVPDTKKLCELASTNSIALLCYERAHHECHRSVVAEELHRQIDARVTAIC